MHTQQKILRLASVLISALLCLGSGLGVVSARAQDQLPGSVGEITLAIGQGKIDGPTGERDIARGQRVYVGDRIQTSDGGHAHIRFVDGGLVSVRPLSRLHIEDYRNAKGDSLAAIKFRLEEGVVRSVTGQWGEANRDRFRLNTPIAAIGVKGTDFVVKVESGTTLASVISGAIIMAPLEGPCAASLGPCQSERSTQLSAEMQGQMLEYLKKNDGGGPKLVPFTDLLARNDHSGSNRELRRNDTIASDDKLNGTALAKTALESGASGGNSRVVLQGKPLVWLHNALGWNVPDHTISNAYSAERVDGRIAAIGNFFINLYRDETTMSAFQPGNASVNFRLSSASANYTQPIGYDRPVEIVQITNPTLAVDFARSTFATRLQLNSPSLGQESFSANGAIDSRGIFIGSSTGQAIAGAFSMDGQQAGYQFEKDAGNGKVSGLTLWGR